MKIILSLIMMSVIGTFIDTEKTYVGYYTQGFEYRTFTECGSDERWWVITNETIQKLKTDLVSPGIEFSYYSRGKNPKVLTKFKGVLSEEGLWGHMGRYSYQLNVNQYLDFGETLQQECDEQNKSSH